MSKNKSRNQRRDGGKKNAQWFDERKKRSRNRDKQAKKSRRANRS